LSGVALLKVWYFKSADKAFLVEVSHQLVFMQHCPHEKIGGLGVLCILQRGSAIRNSRMCLPGDYWGEDMIVKAEWLADSTQAWALTYTEVMSLRRDALLTVLQNHPTMEVKIRKAAVSIAFRNAIRFLGKENNKIKKGAQDSLSSHGARIYDIFDQLTKQPHEQVSLMGMLKEGEAGTVVHAAWNLPGAACQEVEATGSDVTVLSRRLDEIHNALSKRMDHIEKSIATGHQDLVTQMGDRMDQMENLLMSIALTPRGPKRVLPDLPNIPQL
jgi:hypothetical protein